MPKMIDFLKTRISELKIIISQFEFLMVLHLIFLYTL
jgi:hypothetical protein